MKNLILTALLFSAPPALADSLVCDVTKVSVFTSDDVVDCGSFAFNLPHDTETKKGVGKCAGLELASRWFGEEKVQFVITPSKRERGPHGNSGYAWVSFKAGYPADFSLQAIGGNSNYVVRCSVQK